MLPFPFIEKYNKIFVFVLVQYQTVVGPGPHKIESEGGNEEMPDFHLLPQRDQPAPGSK